MRKSLLATTAAASLFLSTLTSGASASSVTYTYDELGRVLSATYSTGQLITYVYDAAGNRVQMTVSAGAPVAVNDSYSTSQNTPLTADPRSNDSGSGLTISSVTQGAHGAVSTTGMSVTYTPTSGFVGSDSFTYTISDSSSRTAVATISITVTAAAGPAAANDSSSTDENVPVVVSVLANDTSPQGYSLSVTGATNGAHGITSVNSGTTITYTPSTNFTGSDSFTYTVSDGHGGTATANVSMTVYTPPTAVNDTSTTAQNTAIQIFVLSNDTSPGGYALSVSSATNGAHGTTVVNNGTSITYTPTTGYSGSDSFIYTIGDGHGGSGTATVSLTITAAAQPPVAVNDTMFAQATYTPPGAAVKPTATIDPRLNDSSPQSYPLTVTGVTQGAKGSVSFTGTTVTYTYGTAEAPGKAVSPYLDTDTFTYTISDGHGGTATATVTVSIEVDNSNAGGGNCGGQPC